MKIAMVFIIVSVMLLLVGSAFAIVHPFGPSNECSDGKGGGGRAIANGGIDPAGAENDKANNPAGVGAPVPKNNPGKGSPSGASVPAAC